jgi:putative transposase
MKGARFSEEQVIGVLKEAEAGAKVSELCRRHGRPSVPVLAPPGDRMLVVKFDERSVRNDFQMTRPARIS